MQTLGLIVDIKDILPQNENFFIVFFSVMFTSQLIKTQNLRII